MRTFGVRNHSMLLAKAMEEVKQEVKYYAPVNQDHIPTEKSSNILIPRADLSM